MSLQNTLNFLMHQTFKENLLQLKVKNRFSEMGRLLRLCCLIFAIGINLDHTVSTSNANAIRVVPVTSLKVQDQCERISNLLINDRFHLTSNPFDEPQHSTLLVERISNPSPAQTEFLFDCTVGKSNPTQAQSVNTVARKSSQRTCRRKILWKAFREQ